jgi:capsular polysaccharide biosynthesis protein
MSNFIEQAYGLDFKKIKEWLKRNGMLILLVSIFAYAIGYYKGQATISLDCKYAKAVRIETEAYECRRIV